MVRNSCGPHIIESKKSLFANDLVLSNRGSGIQIVNSEIYQHSLSPRITDANLSHDLKPIPLRGVNFLGQMIAHC